MQLSLGPLQYLWPRQQVFDFYERMLNLPMEVIYLGETVCSKRRELSTADWLELATTLARQGKQVVLSTLALIEAESELKTLRRICRSEGFLIEANDMAAVELLASQGVPFVCGHSINIYNAQSLAFLIRQGARRWVMPVELSAATLADILQELEAQQLKVETEVFSHGYLPLAYSARCMTARYHQLPKDNCQFICRDYPQGLPARSQEGESLFTMNGIQTQSGAIYNLLEQVPRMQALGVELVRLSPAPTGMEEIIHSFDAARRGEPVQVDTSELTCNGYWFAEPGMIFKSGTSL